MEVQVETQKIPWYRTRLLWGVVMGVQVIFSLVIFAAYYSPSSDFVGNFVRFGMAFGGFPFLGIFSDIFPSGELVRVFSLLFYFLIYLGLIYKTLYTEKVKVIYPLALLVIFLVGIWIGGVYVSGL